MKKLIAGLALAAASWTMAETINVGDFTYRAPVTFPGYTLPGSLANFPVLVRLAASEGGFSYATSSEDGSDIRFTLADGTILPSEVALWNPEGESQIWVSVPTLASDASIMMYWGGTHSFPASQTDGSVWTTAGYFGVWHMDEASGASTAKDSAGGALDGTHVGTSPGQDGVAGRSVRISTSGEQNKSESKGVTTASYGNVGNQFMFSLWAKYPNQDVGNDRLASRKQTYNAQEGWEISGKRYDASHLDMRGSGDQSGNVAVSMKNMGWSHMAFVYDGTGASFYLNNSWKTSGTIGAATDNAVALVLGNDANANGVTFKGWMDEVRLYKGVPAREWITTEYNTVHDASFAAVGARESLVTDEPIPGVLATNAVNPHAVTLAWNLVGAGSSATEVRIAYGTEAGVYTITNVVATALESPDSGTATLSGLHCGTTYYAQLVAENASAVVASEPIFFATTGSPVFSDAALTVVDGAATASATLDAPIDSATVSVNCLFGRSSETPSVVRSWNATTSPETFMAIQTGLSFGTYGASFEADATCSICGNVIHASSETVYATLAGECRWTGTAGDNLWNNPQNWSSGTVPGPLDTAVFGSEASVSGATIELGASQSVKELVVESAGALTIGSADDKASAYSLGAAHVARSGEGAGELSFGAPFLFTEPENGTNTIVSGAAVSFRASLGATEVRPLVKTGAAAVSLYAACTKPFPAIRVYEGNVVCRSGNSYAGDTTVGNGVAETSFSCTVNDACNGGDSGTFTVLTNSTASLQLTNWGHYHRTLFADGGTLSLSGYSYALRILLRGGSINVNGAIYAANYWQAAFISYAADQTAYFNGQMQLNAGGPFDISVEDGNAPVDLVITKNFWWGSSSSAVLSKKGNGTLKWTATGGPNSSSPMQVSGGTLLCDNESGTPIGNTALSVGAGATLGGRGFIGGTERGNVTVAGTSAKTATLAPGSVDEETGAHLYGTLTVGSSAVTNAVTLGNYSQLTIGVGPKDPETKLSPADKLMVNGNLDIGSNCTLDLTANSAALDKIAGGTYTIVEADAITGTFATITKPKSSWKVAYVSEEVDNEPVVKRIVLTIPDKGLAVFVR